MRRPFGAKAPQGNLVIDTQRIGSKISVKANVSDESFVSEGLKAHDALRQVKL
jgi:hypothetical protein